LGLDPDIHSKQKHREMESQSPIYLDHNSTTPCAPEVIEAMMPYFAQEFGNPASPHRMGRSAANAVEQARICLAELVSCDSEEIIFTSGATESNNIVLLGVAGASQSRRRIITSAIEHKSVLQPCEFLEKQGFEVVTLPVDRKGVVDIEVAEKVINEETLLVSVQGANNETGVIQPISHLAAIARAHGALIHADCAQMLGKVPFSIFELDVDFASFSAHKMYGPKGIGALFVAFGRAWDRLSPICFGGGQEKTVRPGTSNTPAIVGFGEACRIANNLLPEESQRLAILRDKFEREILRSLGEVQINGALDSRLPGTSSITIEGVPADALIANLPSLCISEGSACTSGNYAPSHVLLAMGFSSYEAENTVRFGFGRYNNLKNVVLASQYLINCVQILRGKADI